MGAAEQHLRDVHNAEPSEPPEEVESRRAALTAGQAAEVVIEHLVATFGLLPDLRVVYGLVQHVRERGYPTFCDVICGYHHFGEVLVDLPAGAPERLIAEPDGDANEALLEAVLEAIGQRVVTIVAPPPQGPWPEADGTIVALVRPPALGSKALIEVTFNHTACAVEPGGVRAVFHLPTSY